MKFSIPKNGVVKFKVYNSLGKEVFSNSKYFIGGANIIEYYPENLSSGIYFYSVESGNNILTRKMILVK
ncbi:MAG: T9SS type A sorting domain-containing protein [Ignavibacteria bacterium]|nr:T9SS type A sorting domain-containing protein [Ignavibacteria bacterium]